MIVSVLMFGPRKMAVWLGLVVLLGGCGGGGDGLQREAVSGRVSVDGSPLEEGSIQFLPTQSGQRSAAWGRIVDGAYSIRAGEGPVAGEYSVSITSTSAGSADSDALPGDDEGLSATDAIPEQYNLMTTLRATVEAGRDNEFHYELTSGPAARTARRP